MQYIKHILNQADQVLTLSKASKTQLDKLGVKNVKVFKFWEDMEKFRPKRFTILFVGRPMEKKGYLLLEHLELKFPELDFVYVTDMPRKYIHLMYRLADIVVVPSLYEEAYGLVAMEALCSGVPVIVSNRGGLPEHVTEEVGSIIEPTETILESAIWSMIKRLIKEPDLKQKCREYALKNFGVENAETITKEY